MTSFTLDAAHQLNYALNQDAGGVTFAYDANGSRIRQAPIGEIPPGNPLTPPTTFAYDAAHRLTA